MNQIKKEIVHRTARNLQLNHKNEDLINSFLKSGDSMRKSCKYIWKFCKIREMCFSIWEFGHRTFKKQILCLNK